VCTATHKSEEQKEKARSEVKSHGKIVCHGKSFDAQGCSRT
jgi:hypothetical protein